MACATAAAAGLHGKLSSVEYTQLRSAFKAMKADSEHNPPQFTAMDSACRTLTNATPMLKVEREDCIGQIAFLAAASSIAKLTKSCSDSEATIALEDHCMLPAYKRLATDAVVMHQGDTRAAAVARGRGFGGRCVDVLADSPKVIADELRISYVAEDIVDDLQVDAEKDLFSDSDRLAKAEKALAKDAGESPTNVSICPHRPALPGSGSVVGIAA